MVSGLEKIAGLSVLNEHRYAAYTGADGGKLCSCTLGESIGKGFRKRGESVYVDRGKKTVNAVYPSGEADLLFNSQFTRKSFKLCFLCAVARDDKTKLLLTCCGIGKAAQQGWDVFNRV